MTQLRLITHAAELLTGEGVRAKDGRKIEEGDLGRYTDASIVYSVEQDGETELLNEVLWVGKTENLPKEYFSIPSVDLEGRSSIYPGFVDCHTHLVFAGNRANEFARRCGGVSYEKIAQEGGGIVSTIQPTRDASLQELDALTEKRILEMARYGVRTIEVKSGYGLSEPAELKSLEVIRRARRKFPKMRFQSTYLGAHAFPPDREQDEYFQEMLDKTLPKVAAEQLADACDIFVDRGYFSIEQAEKLLSKAKDLGLKIKLHGDELADTGSAEFATKIGALSVDHLLQISDAGIKALGESDTVGVLLPGTAFYLKADYAPARKLIDAGACVAISTDYNPGSSMCASLPFIMTLSALYMGMTRAEIFAGVTYNAAKALGMHEEIGTIELGRKADFSVLPVESFEEMYYQVAWVPSDIVDK